MVPAGPVRPTLLTTRLAAPVAVAPLTGESGTGVCRMTSAPITKLDAFGAGPRSPPLTARARQKYVADAGSLSMATDVAPLAPCATPVLVTRILLNATSVATSNV